jgi:fatty acid hydroxylase domain-containing protein 2
MSLKYTINAFGLHFITYWTLSLLCYIIDLFVLDKKHDNWKKYKNAAYVSFLNQILISLPTMYLMSPYMVDPINKSENDNLIIMILKVFSIINLSNILFYCTHYILHIKSLYQLIHAKHHEFIEPIAVAALYAHPIEHLISNLLVFFVPFMYIGTNETIAYLLIVGGTIVTITAHCDYKFLKNAHAAHHKLFVYNYGFGGYLDKIMGTYKN